MTSNIYVISNYVFDTIVVAHDFNCIDYTNVGYATTRGVRSLFWENFVIVTSDDQMSDGVSSSDFYLAVMATNYYAVTGFHKDHWNTVVRNIDWVWSIVSPHSNSSIGSHVLTSKLKLNIASILHPSHLRLSKCLPKVLWKVYKELFK